MRLLIGYFVFFFAIGLLSGCKRDNTSVTPGSAASQTELLTANAWRVDRVTDMGGRNIDRSRLGLQTTVLFDLLFQFINNNVVRATDRTSKQIVNAGDWSLTDDNTAVNVKVTGFTGKFKIVELTRSSLILQQEGVPVDGTKQTANLIFVPSV